jgi:hypothetical protein
MYTSKVFPDRSTSPGYKVAYLGQHRGIHFFSLFHTEVSALSSLTLIEFLREDPCRHSSRLELVCRFEGSANFANVHGLNVDLP